MAHPVLAALALAALTPSGPVVRRGEPRPVRPALVNPLQVSLDVVVPGGLAVAATCIEHADPALGGPTGGTLSLTDLPVGAEVVDARIYWTVLSATSPVPSGAPTLDGVPLTVVPVAETTGTPCFDDSDGDTLADRVATGVFRADVAGLVRGNGDYRIAGMLGSGDETGDFTEGATLLVTYCAPGGTETQVVVWEGADITRNDVAPPWVFTQDLSGLRANGTAPVAARLVLVAGNGQGYWRLPDADRDPVEFNGSDLDREDPAILSGSLCPPPTEQERGGLYDLTVIDVTGLVPPSATTATLEVRAEGDCHSIAAVALAVRTTPGTLLPEPSALDARPAAAPLRVRRVAPDRLRVDFEDVGRPPYALHRGDVGNWYSHRDVGACNLAAPSAEIPIEPGDHYLLAATSGCAGSESSSGRDSRGRERPSALAASGNACP